jgi:peptidyl-tRNA hydrolase, PTH1 family
MKFVVGLGNPGEKYLGTRHNLGFEVVDELVRRMELGEWSIENKLKSEIIKTPEIILVKPQTFMNNSGQAVKLIADYFKINPEDIIIVHDDLDLMLGTIKVRVGGSAAGHHGVESIINSLGTDQFTRVRVGIGNDQSHGGEHNRVHFEAEKFVLEPFNQGESSKHKQAIKLAMEALEKLLEIDNRN